MEAEDAANNNLHPRTCESSSQSDSTGPTPPPPGQEEGFEVIEKLSRMPPVQHPHVYGRDASNPYYDFLYRLVEHYKPRLVVELGTCTGGSTSYLAAGCPSTRVISVDMVQHPETAKRLSAFPNVELWTYNTNDPAFKEALEKEGPIDLLFIDTEHNYQQAKSEYESFAPMVRSGGLILCDDVRMSGMGGFWDELAEPKLELNHLHWSGLGVLLATISSPILEANPMLKEWKA